MNVIRCVGLLSELSDCLLPPGPQDLESPTSIAYEWLSRSVDTAQGSLLLKRNNLGHVAGPSDRLLLELVAHTSWLSRADQPALALKALKAESLRIQKKRFEGCSSFAMVPNEYLNAGISRTEKDLLEAEDVPESEKGLFKSYKGQVRNFEQLVKSLDNDLLYVQYRFMSSNTHAGLDLARIEAGRTGTGATGIVDSVWTPGTILNVVAISVLEYVELLNPSNAADLRVWLNDVRIELDLG